ncbi:MAG: 4Fe-4S binding protein [Clostridiales bacterium]|nr:4Fe-4S binding protein [Clostridiales bacterium]
MAVSVIESICTGCGICEKLCPADAIRVEEGKARAYDNCITCGACVKACPVCAIRNKAALSYRRV